jgi:hypothetical protein
VMDDILHHPGDVSDDHGAEGGHHDDQCGL